MMKALSMLLVTKKVKPLCIILLQMSGYIKYFKKGGKNMSFFIKDDKCGENTKKCGMWLKIN